MNLTAYLILFFGCWFFMGIFAAVGITAIPAVIHWWNA